MSLQTDHVPCISHVDSVIYKHTSCGLQKPLYKDTATELTRSFMVQICIKLFFYAPCNHSEMLLYRKPKSSCFSFSSFCFLHFLSPCNKINAYVFFFLFFFLFGFYGPFKNISLISSRSFIKGGRKPENSGKTT